MNDILTFVTENFKVLPEIVQALIVLFTSIVTAATTITMATPTKVDDTKLPYITKPLNAVLKVLNVLAGNILKNKNKDSV